jgi:hypothetical protein
MDALFAHTVDLFHRADILVNNAGATDGAPLTEISMAMWDKVIATNLKGPFLCTRAAMRVMKKQGGGRILKIDSISAQRPRLNAAPYAASKFGLSGLTTMTALEGARIRDISLLFASGKCSFGGLRRSGRGGYRNCGIFCGTEDESRGVSRSCNPDGEPPAHEHVGGDRPSRKVGLSRTWLSAMNTCCRWITITIRRWDGPR